MMDRETDEWLFEVFKKSVQFNALNPRAKVRLLCFHVAYALAKTHPPAGPVSLESLSELTGYHPQAIWTGLCMLQTIGACTLFGCPDFDLRNNLVEMRGTAFARQRPRLQANKEGCHVGAE